MYRHQKAWKIFAKDARINRDYADVVIIGNGIAGLTTAVEVRRLDPDKRIVIITEQCHPTINTPSLKQFAIGKLTQEQLLAYPVGTERTQRIEVFNTRVDGIKAREKYVSLRNGQHFGYGKLLLATGSKPSGLSASIPGCDFDGVLTLHRLGDYLNLRRRLLLREVQTAVVIGGGLHAVETVIGLLHEGIQVHWLIRSTNFLPSMLDHTASEMVLEYSRRLGAHVSTETEVVGVVGKIGTVAGVVTTNQQTISCQLVLICTGTTPVTALADHCDVPLKHQRGILVDDHLRTSVRDIYAAGDAVALWNPQIGTYLRHACWHTAALQGCAAAATMLDVQEERTPFGVPWHATQLGELSLLTVGNPLHTLLEAEMVTDKRKGNYRLLAMHDDRLVGYLSLGKAQPDSLAIKRIIDEGLPIRDIEKSLRIGEFDARQYFAQRDTHAAYAAHSAHKTAIMVKIAVPDTPLPLFQAHTETKTTHNTEPLLFTPKLHRLHEISEEDDLPQKQVQQEMPHTSSIMPLMGQHIDTSEWTVPTILPEGLIVLTGKQKIGKSSLGLAIGLGVASGETVLGDIEVEQGHVLYLALEESERRLQEQLSQLLMLGASLHQNFEYMTNWPRLDDDGIADIESWLVSHPQARLVVIDSWTHAQPEQEQLASETAQKDDDIEYEAFERLKELAHAYHISILVHYHLDKTTSDQYVGKLTMQSSSYAYADGILHLKRLRGSRDATLSGGGRAYAQNLKLALSFNDGYWKKAEHSSAPVRSKDNLSQARRAIIEVLHERDKPMKPGEIALALGKRDQTVRKMLFEMKASSLIRATEQGYIALVPQKEYAVQV